MKNMKFSTTQTPLSVFLCCNSIFFYQQCFYITTIILSFWTLFLLEKGQVFHCVESFNHSPQALST